MQAIPLDKRGPSNTGLRRRAIAHQDLMRYVAGTRVADESMKDLAIERRNDDSGRAVDRRVASGIRPGLSPMGQLAFVLMRALRLAATNGPDAKLREFGVAQSLGVGVAALRSWVTLEGTGKARAEALVSLLCDPTTVPHDARRRALEVLASAAGFGVVELTQAGPDGAAPAVQMLQVSAALGQLSAKVEAAATAQSQGGSTITPGEAKGMLPAALAVQREVAELVETLTQISAKLEGGAGKKAGKNLNGVGRLVDVHG